MRKKIRAAALAAAVTAGVAVAALPAGASGAAAVHPCTMNDVSFYFGGYSYGLGQRTFDLTLLAHDGITCSLSDTPLITLAGPPSQKKKIPVQINGRGGTLILRPNSPLHARFYYAIPDTPQDSLYVTTLTLAMPDKTSRVTDFLYPGNTAIYSGGVSISSWTTGIGLGEGEQSF
ncbi:hypothetical protein [Actinospica sp.]|uniref:hypothetical protein n=1 Tax=Actinospica sp. TaxID=1872142 RepID=UPI002CBEF43E|nr:hypothetical protein [Actinospica sp.]HWG24802.1 hypothetical protein [Actinospica sp.]